MPGADQRDNSLCRQNRFESAGGNVATADDKDAFAFELPGEEERCIRHCELKLD